MLPAASKIFQLYAKINYIIIPQYIISNTSLTCFRKARYVDVHLSTQWGGGGGGGILEYI